MRVLRENGSEATAQNVHKVRRPAEARRAGASLPVIVIFYMARYMSQHPKTTAPTKYDKNRKKPSDHPANKL